MGCYPLALANGCYGNMRSSFEEEFSAGGIFNGERTFGKIFLPLRIKLSSKIFPCKNVGNIH